MTARRSSHLLPRSLTARLALAFALIAGCAFAGVGLYLYRALAAQIIERDDSELLRKAVRMRAELAEMPAADAQAGRWQEIRGIVAGNEEFGLRLTAPDGRLLADAGSKPGAQPGAGRTMPVIGPDTPPSRDAIQTWQARGDIPVRGLAMQARLGADASGQTVLVDLHQVAASRVVLLRDYRLKLSIAVCLGALGAGLLGFVALRAGMAPLRRIAAGTASVTFASGVLPVDPSRLPAELDELARSLQRMIDRLRERYERLSQFSADLAHDFRTPIGNLLGQTQVTLSSERSVEEYQALLASNVEEYERLSRMIENMLFLARADNAQVALGARPLDARAELDKVAEYFEAVAADRNLTVMVSGHATVVADQTLLRRAIINLLDNALRHAPVGSAVRMAVARNGSDMTAISVTNGGPAIEADALPHLFGRFYRADPSRRNSSGSTGLGLAIVDTIMRLHGGSVSVTSVEEQTRFELEFPDNSVSRAGA